MAYSSKSSFNKIEHRVYEATEYIQCEFSIHAIFSSFSFSLRVLNLCIHSFIYIEKKVDAYF